MKINIGSYTEDGTLITEIREMTPEEVESISRMRAESAQDLSLEDELRLALMELLGVNE